MNHRWNWMAIFLSNTVRRRLFAWQKSLVKSTPEKAKRIAYNILTWFSRIAALLFVIEKNNSEVLRKFIVQLQPHNQKCFIYLVFQMLRYLRLLLYGLDFFSGLAQPDASYHHEAELARPGSWSLRIQDPDEREGDRRASRLQSNPGIHFLTLRIQPTRLQGSIPPTFYAQLLRQ